MANPKAALAKIYLTNTKQGGRKHPIYSGFRPGLWLGPQFDWFYNCEFLLKDKEACYPGEECEVRIDFGSPDVVAPFLKPHGIFTIQEGEQVVGRGVIIEVISDWQIKQLVHLEILGELSSDTSPRWHLRSLYSLSAE